MFVQKNKKKRVTDHKFIGSWQPQAPITHLVHAGSHRRRSHISWMLAATGANHTLAGAVAVAAA
jgi:hypothetical protein